MQRYKSQYLYLIKEGNDYIHHKPPTEFVLCDFDSILAKPSYVSIRVVLLVSLSLARETRNAIEYRSVQVFDFTENYRKNRCRNDCKSEFRAQKSDLQ